MMPAVFRSLLYAAERRVVLQAGSCLSKVHALANGSLRLQPLRATASESTGILRGVSGRNATFASAAVAEEKQVQEAEAEQSRPQPSAAELWMELDEPVKKATKYTPQLAAKETADARHETTAVAAATEVAEDGPSSSDDDDDSDESRAARIHSGATAGTLLSLDEQVAEESIDDDLQDLNWDDSDEDFDQHRRSKYTPYGPRPKRKYPREKKRKGIGPPAVVPPLPDFDMMLPRLQAYKDKFGDCLVPKRFWEDFELGDWTHRIRVLLKDKQLPVRQFEVLESMGFPWAVPEEVATWEGFYQELRRYKEEFGHIDIPFKWKDPMADFNNHFARWFHAQPTLFLQRRLRPDQVRKLMITGYDMRQVTGDDIGKADYIAAQKQISSSAEKNEFEIMFAEMEAWKATYYTTVVPRMVYDNPVLGMWAWKLRRDQRNNKLAQWKIDRLAQLEFLWKVDQVTSKWHHNLHETRRYKEVHGTANIPADYTNPAEPAWQEASRWLQRQAKLFRKQKLSDKRYRIMREVLGIKFVRQYAPRVKENRHKMGIQHVQAKRLPRYAPPIKKNVLI